MEIEVWKSVHGFEGFYEVSTVGRVRSLTRKIKVEKTGQIQTWKGKILSPNKDRDGYLRVRLSKNGKGKYFQVHRLVAAIFIRPPLDDEQVNHINFIKCDNRVSNLEWCSLKENIAHSARLGRKEKKLKIEDIENIGDMFSSGFSKKEIAQFYGVTEGSVRYVLKHKFACPL